MAKLWTSFGKGDLVAAEHKARDVLDRIGVQDTHSLSAGDLVELANLIAARDRAGHLLRQALEALEYHTEQTRPIQRTDAAIAALREASLNHMEEARAAKQDDSAPLVREGGTTFIRHDEVRVVQRAPGKVSVEFRWRGVLAHTMQVDCDFAAGQLLTLTGLEGRVGISPRVLYA